MTHELEIEAAVAALIDDVDTLSPRLRDAGYKRWINDAGDLRVLQTQPQIGGPWRLACEGEGTFALKQAKLEAARALVLSDAAKQQLECEPAARTT